MKSGTMLAAIGCGSSDMDDSGEGVMIGSGTTVGVDDGYDDSGVAGG